jgi:hypothetical protein
MEAEAVAPGARAGAKAEGPSTPIAKADGKNSVAAAEGTVTVQRPKRENPDAGAHDSKRSRSGKKYKDTDASLAALNLLQPFNVPQYRFTPVVPFETVTLSPFDRAPQLRLSKDALTVSGYKGYRLIRGTHGVSQGAWYCEATILDDFNEPDLEER